MLFASFTCMIAVACGAIRFLLEYLGEESEMIFMELEQEKWGLLISLCHNDFYLFLDVITYSGTVIYAEILTRKLQIFVNSKEVCNQIHF